MRVNLGELADSEGGRQVVDLYMYPIENDNISLIR